MRYDSWGQLHMSNQKMLKTEKNTFAAAAVSWKLKKIEAKIGGQRDNNFISKKTKMLLTEV